MSVEADKAERIWAEETQRQERWYQSVAILALFAGIGVAAGVICTALIYQLM
jgi:hypothetical protein